jgi:hypothetical protein
MALLFSSIGVSLCIFASQKASYSSSSPCFIMQTVFASLVILIWRLYAIYDCSKRLLYVLLGLFLPIVALLIGTDIYLWSRPSAFSGGF